MAQFYQAQVLDDEEHGMPVSLVYDIAQSAEGEIWFTTIAGVYTYDGQYWTLKSDDTVPFPNSEFNIIKSLPDSSIWLTGFDGEGHRIMCYKNNQWLNFPAPPIDFGFFIHHFDFDVRIEADGYHIAIHDYNNKLYYFNTYLNYWKVIDVPGENTTINRLRFHKSSLYIGTSVGLYKMKFGGISKVGSFSQSIYGIDFGGDTCFVRLSNSIGYLLEGDYTELKSPLKNPVVLPLESNEFFIDNKHNIYYSYRSPLSRINRKDNNKEENIQVDHDLMYSIASGALVDTDQNIWVSTVRGCYKIESAAFLNYTKRSGLPENEVSAILNLQNGKIVLGGVKDLSVLDKKGEMHNYYLANQDIIFQSRILDLAEGVDGTIYIAANKKGLGVLPKGAEQIKWYSTGNDIYDAVIACEVIDGKVIVALINSICEFKNGQLTLLTSGVGYVRSISKLSGNRGLLLCSRNGLFHIKNNNEAPINYVSKDMKCTNTYSSLEYEGKILIGTAGGLCELRNDSIIDLTLGGLQPGIPIYKLMLDSKKRLWAGTNNGVFTYEKGKGWRHFTVKDGLVGPEVNRKAIEEDEDGRVWIGTNKGASVYFEEYDFSKKLIPQTKIDSISYGVTNTRSTNESIEVAAKDNDLSFYFRGVIFNRTDSLNYRVQLEGFDKDWRYIVNGRENSARYTNLPGGTYRFRCQSRVGDREWSKEVSTGSIKVFNPFYLTWWFVASSIIAVALFVYFIYRLRMNILERRNRDLEKEIKKRTTKILEQSTEILNKNKALEEKQYKVLVQNEELQAQQEELSNKNDQLEATLENLKNTQSQLVQAEKMASLGILTAGIAHEINNPINYINSGIEGLRTAISTIGEIVDKYNELTAENFVEKMKEIEELKSQVKYERLLTLVKKAPENIGVGAKRAAAIVKELRTFSRIDSDDSHKFDVLQGVDSALVLLRHQYKDRIEIVKSYDKIPLIECFPGKLNQVFMNVLSNSIQSIPEQGTITITSKLLTDGSLLDKDCVSIIITDTGIGIPKENLNRIFEPFFTTKDVGKGTGLGLSISLGVIEAHGGKMLVESEVGNGTSFTILLPLHQ
ncbi:ATP-binding protein [Flammeovirgaceae bacterium SG7u.111]|nr:ATP-binding protein [Flammeovirgaceae bacterium SG7u.132]WPO38358.1 ATP-binding protein [Flammeovirgaceae bacterium SG7u.111]